MELRFDGFVTVSGDDRGNEVCKSWQSQYWERGIYKMYLD